MPQALSGIYAISDEILTPYHRILTMLEQALKEGVSIFQLRDKRHKDHELKPLCLELKDLCESYQSIFIINDRYELALELSCGVHLGKEEIHKLKQDIKAHRTQIQLPYIGISCYQSLALAKEAKELGADYVAFGSCFHSPTKPTANQVDLNIFNEAKNLNMPLCAIGGITPKNVHLLKNVDIIAIISGIWTGNIEANIEAFKQALQRKDHGY